MRFLRALVVLALILATLPAAAAPVEARLAVEREGVGAGESLWIALVLDIAPGWHVYGNKPGETGLPTKVDWVLPSGFVAGAPIFPPTRRDVTGGIESEILEGRVLVLSKIQAPESIEGEGPLHFEAKASWLACAASCIPGSARLAIEVPVAQKGRSLVDSADAALIRDALVQASARGRQSGAGSVSMAALVSALALAFLGGLLLNLMPCVLPVLSLKLSGLVRRSGRGRREGLSQGLLYGAGILAAFEILAMILIIMKTGGAAIGWGFQFQNPVVVAVSAWLFFMIALNLFGLYGLGFRLAGRAGEAAGAMAVGGGGASSFGEGFLATFAATPCTAPFMGAALGWAVAQPPGATIAVFAALGAGMALPIVLLAAWPSLLSRLPAPGRWMESLRIGMGFPMTATTLWLAWILGRLAGGEAVNRLLVGLLVSALGAWVWGRWGGFEAEGRRRLAVSALSLVLAAGGLTISGSAESAYSPRGLGSTGASSALPFSWEPWSPARVASLRAASRPVFVAFTADWCLSCKVNEAAVLDTSPVIARFEELGVARLLADWTAPNAEIAATLDSFGRAGVPLYLFFSPGEGRARVLPELLTKKIVFDALDSLPRP